MFFAVVRFSPPSQEGQAAKRKAEEKNNSPDSQEPFFNLLVAAMLLQELRVLRGKLNFLPGESGLYHNRDSQRQKNSDIQLDPEKLKNRQILLLPWCGDVEKKKTVTKRILANKGNY